MAANIERMNPETLPTSPLFNRVVTISGGKTVEVAGMTAMGVDGNLIGAGDLAAQAKQVYEYVRLALEAAGATPGDVVRQRVYIVNVTPEDRAIFVPAMNEFYGDGPRPVSTLVGVPSLAMDGTMIEIDVTAVIDD